MLLRPWQRDDVAVRKGNAVAAAGEGSCCGPGERCIQYIVIAPTRATSTTAIIASPFIYERCNLYRRICLCVCVATNMFMPFTPAVIFNHLNTAVLHFTCSNLSNTMLLLLWKYSQLYWHGRCLTTTHQRGGIGLGIGIGRSKGRVRGQVHFEVWG